MRANENGPNEYTQPSRSTDGSAIDPKRRYLCRHVFADGHRCGSPSLRGEDLCYYHTRSRREAPSAFRGGTFRMAAIDDRTSVQLALFDILTRVAAGDIEYRCGSVLLYGLQIASSNLAHQEKLLAARPPQVEEITSDYELGDLAPIVEIPDANPAAPTAQPATDAGAAAPNLVEDATTQDDVVLPSELHEPVLPNEFDEAVIPSEPDEPVILSEVMDPRIFPEAPTSIAAPPTPSVAEAPPADPPPPPLHPPLPTHDASGRRYPPPHKLDPPSNGRVPRPRRSNLEPSTSNLAPRYTTHTHDSYPPMAP